MTRFLNLCADGKDYLRQKREAALTSCVPMLDGLAGERVKNDISLALSGEIPPA